MISWNTTAAVTAPYTTVCPQANGSHTEVVTPDACANGSSHHLQQIHDQDRAVATSSTHDPPAYQNGHNVITHSEFPAPNGTSHQPAHQEPPAASILLQSGLLHDSPSQQPHQLLTSSSSITTSTTPTPLQLEHDEHNTILPASTISIPQVPSAVLDQSQHTQGLEALTHSVAQLQSALKEAEANKSSSHKQLAESLSNNLALQEQVERLLQEKSSLQLETSDAHAVCAASETAQLTLQASLSFLQAQSDEASRVSLALQEQTDALLATQTTLQQEVLEARTSYADSQAAQTSLQALSVSLQARFDDAVHSLASLQACSETERDVYSHQGTLLENAQLAASEAAREVQALREQLQQSEAGAEERIQNLQETLLQERNQIQQLQEQIQNLHALSGQDEQLVQSQQSQQQQLKKELQAALDALASATLEAHDAKLLLADTVAEALRQSEESNAEHAAQTSVHLARVAELEHAVAASDAELSRSSEEAAALIKQLQEQLSGAENACQALEAGTAAAQQQDSGWAHDVLEIGDSQPGVGEGVVSSDGRVAELEARIAVLEGVEGKYTALVATQARAKTQFEKAKALLKERKEELEKAKAQVSLGTCQCIGIALWCDLIRRKYLGCVRSKYDVPHGV